MDKATTALIATEDNAAAIRALSKSLRDRIESNTAAIAALEKKIGSGGGGGAYDDDIRTAVQNNTEAIESLKTELTRLTTNRLITSRTVLTISSFGQHTSDGTVAAIFFFTNAETRTCIFAGKNLGPVSPREIYILPAGSGAFTLSGTATATVLLLGGRTEATAH